MNNNKYTKNKYAKNQDKRKEKLDEKFGVEYGYDFVPELNHWTNIDEQKQKVNSLEKISKNIE